tara:strand:+ start:177 stop:446 length:270 start_codon:yes stop_codon:yes gene_type:complete
MNLKEAFDTVKSGTPFVYDLNTKITYSYESYTTCSQSNKHFSFSDKANFDANLKAFILENATKLVCENTHLRVELGYSKDIVFFEIIFT